MQRPPEDEDDWSIGHAACLYADRLGRGAEYALAAMNERWEKGEFASTPEAVARVSESLGLNPQEVVDAATSDALQSEIVTLVQTNFDERDVFGVPMFILPTGEFFWGHDRMDWALRHGYVPTSN